MDMTFGQLPYKQKLFERYRKSLAPLVEKQRDIFFRLDDREVAPHLFEAAEKCGFNIRHVPAATETTLARELARPLRKNGLLILNYRPPQSGASLIGLLRNLTRLISYESCSYLIPVLIANPASEKQLEVFHLLGQFGIAHVIFIPPVGTPEHFMEGFLKGLAEYAGLTVSPEPREEAEPKPLKKDAAEKSERFRQMMEQGKTLMERGKYEEAIAFFSRALEAAPDPSAYISRGDAYYFEKQFPEALTDYREASRLEAAMPEPHARIGNCCFNMAKRLAGSSVPKARRFMEMGLDSVKKAVDMIEKLEKDTGLPPLGQGGVSYKALLNAVTETDLRGVGLDKEEKELQEVADRILQKTINVNWLKDDLDVDMKIDKAILLTRRGQYGPAEEIFQSIIKADPAHAGPVYNNFAVELRKNGQHGRAFEAYLELLKYEIPDRNIVLRNMKKAGGLYAEELRDMGKQEEALEVYKRILMHKPKGREYILCEMAMVALENMDQAGASSRLMEAIYINPRLTESKEFEKFGDLSSIAREMVKKIKESFFGQDLR